MAFHHSSVTDVNHHEPAGARSSSVFRYLLIYREELVNYASVWVEDILSEGKLDSSLAVPVSLWLLRLCDC